MPLDSLAISLLQKLPFPARSPERMSAGKEFPLPRCYELLLGKDQEKWPPEARLICAAYYGKVRQIKKFAKIVDVQGNGIPSTVANTAYIGMKAIHAAGGRGNLLAYRYLVEEVKMDVNEADTTQGFTPVEHAIVHGHLPAVRYLADHGADLDWVRSRVSLLHTAAVHGHPEIVKFLLSRGANVDADSDIGTPLALAATRGYASTIKILLEHNADCVSQPRHMTGDSQTTALKNQWEQRDPNKASRLGGPLTMALHKSYVSCVKLLIEGGANVNGCSPCDDHLVMAAEKGLTEAIKCLLDAGSNPNAVDTFGRLPIELAAEYGTREDVELLFPSTSPISTVKNWSVDGIISHVKMEIKQLEDAKFVKTKKADLKLQADEAFKKGDYVNASVFYTQALKVDNFDAKLLSNRSLCWLRMGNGARAYNDAKECTIICPKWAKAHYRKGAALMFMKDYTPAYYALSRALELDPQSEETEKLFWEAMELRE